MLYSSAQLAALLAVCESGSFDGAAAQLRITPSALSQRISAFEREVGQVLVERGRPTTPTEAGRVMLSLAQRVALSTADANHALRIEEPGGDPQPTRVSLAINADSISTWFQPTMAAVARDRKVLLDLHVEDQDHTDELLCRGDVMAAVTTSNKPAPGCRVEPLGAMIYWTACAPSLLGDANPEAVDLARLPMLRFDIKDDLQHSMLRKLGIGEAPPTHLIPSNREFLTAARLGLGWGVLPRDQIQGDLAAGRLVRLLREHTVEVDLFWQRWRLESQTLDELTKLVRQAASQYLC